MLAGLGASIIAHDELEPGMRVLGPAYGLPPLPDLEFALIWSPGGKTPCARELGRLIIEATQGPGGAVPRRLRQPAARAGTRD